MPLTNKNNIYVNIKYENSTNLEENKKLTNQVYTLIKEFFDKRHPNAVKYIQINI